MAEPVRLVVWDLDETFWSGTISEEGISYNANHHHIVVKLAERGIMSSICSKNDRDVVERVLLEKGLWDYFIFPSINWEAKGPRLQALVDAVQLRPSTILFIDDNHFNREEAAFFVPGMQIRDESYISSILSDPSFKGRDDPELSRLKQYKLLEKKKEEEASFSGDNREFLRSCDITVELEFDIESNIDRAIELINRTNQLNFTKNRLSENIDEARAQLRSYIANHFVTVGLVIVRDRYGDYGYSGFYGFHHGSFRYFCFSCRILNMGIETWLYRHLGRLKLDVKGEVLTDVFDEIREIDWIRLATSKIPIHSLSGKEKLFSQIIGRGGCDLSALLHYMSPLATTITAILQTTRSGVSVRPDHSILLKYSLEGITSTDLETLSAVALSVDEVRPVLNDNSKLWILSFWGDAEIPLYQSRKTGVIVPFHVHEYTKTNIIAVTPEDFRMKVKDPAYKAFHNQLRSDFTFYGLISEACFKANLRFILSKFGPEDAACILLLNDTIESGGKIHVDDRMRSVNSWIREVIDGFTAVGLVSIRDFVKDEVEIHSWNHFDRMVYVRVANEIMRMAGHLRRTTHAH